MVMGAHHTNSRSFWTDSKDRDELEQNPNAEMKLMAHRINPRSTDFKYGDEFDQNPNAEMKLIDGSPYQSKVLPDWTRSAWRQRPHLGTAALGSFPQIHLQRRCLNHFLELNSYKNLQRRCVNHFSELKSYKSQNSHVSTSPTPSSGRAPKCRQILFTFVLDDYILFIFVVNDFIVHLLFSMIISLNVKPNIVHLVLNEQYVHLCSRW